MLDMLSAVLRQCFLSGKGGLSSTFCRLSEFSIRFPSRCFLQLVSRIENLCSPAPSSALIGALSSVGPLRLWLSCKLDHTSFSVVFFLLDILHWDSWVGSCALARTCRLTCTAPGSIILHYYLLF